MDKNQREIIDLVVARLQTIPEGVGVSMGSKGNFSREDLIKHVKANDEIGKKVMDVEMSFLQ